MYYKIIIILILCFLNLQAFAVITFNRKEPIEIEGLIETVSIATGKKFILDQRVKGKISIISDPIDEADLYDVFLSILDVYGFSAIEAGDITKIIPNSNAKQEPVPLGSTKNNDAIITQVIKVENVPAAQLVPILRPLVPQQGHLAAYPASNSLIISDRASNVRRLVEIIKRLDLDSNSDIDVVPLTHASASEVVRILNSLKAAQDPNSGKTSTLLASDDRTNSILISGDKADRLRIKGLIIHLDTPLSASGNTKVVYLRFAQAEELAPILKNIYTAQEKEAGKNKRNEAVDIQADNSTNALIITAPPDLQREFLSTIQQLDIRRAQVLVEAIIAEVSIDKARELGLDFAIADTSNGTVPAAAMNLSGQIVNLYADPTSIRQGGLSLAIGDISGSGVSFGLLLQALASDGTTNILSTPSLMTLDNHEAEIVVGQNVPFVTGSYTSTGTGTTNPFQTIERQDVGITLKVKPQINEGNAITLEITQEVTSLASSAVSTADVITNKRSIETNVLVEDGQLLVLGGLIDETTRDSLSKIPGLGDIPFIGNLFRYRNSDRLKQNLMIFIRPRIVRDTSTADLISQDKYNYMKAKQLESLEDNISLFKEDPTVLPDLDQYIVNIPNLDDAWDD